MADAPHLPVWDLLETLLQQPIGRPSEASDLLLPLEDLVGPPTPLEEEDEPDPPSERGDPTWTPTVKVCKAPRRRPPRRGSPASVTVRKAPRRRPPREGSPRTSKVRSASMPVFAAQP